MGFNTIELLVLDVDGVLTDGSITLSAEGEAAKTFHVRDGCAIELWRRCGGKVAVCSGRSGPAVPRRAAELGIEWVHMGVADKAAGFEKILKESGLKSEAVAYFGDDLPDLEPLSRCGFGVAVADAAPQIKRAADYVTRRRGGCGVVAEVVELLLRKQKRWSRSLLRASGARFS